MKMGFVSAILDTADFEQVIDFASKENFQCVELAAWKREKAERRYAGVSHIDTENLTKEKAEYIIDYCKSRNVAISSLAFYPNNMDSDLKKRQANIDHLMSVIDASSMLGVNMVTTFIGRDQSKTLEENLELLSAVWVPIVRYAEQKKVRIAIENCPMLFGNDQWPGGQNLMTSPVIWNEVFSILDSDYLGINFDPSHFVWQGMDYIKAIYEFKDKIFHVHFKDIKVDRDKLSRCGTLAYPLDFMAPKLPGLGDVDWGQYVSALTDIGYDSYACIEVEDRAFESSDKRIRDSIILSKRYLDNFVI